MVCNDHIWRLPLKNQRPNDIIQRMKSLLCEVHTGTGIYEPLSVLAISCLGVVVILRLDRTAATCFITTVADIRCTFDLPTFFSFKARTDRVTSQARLTVPVTDFNLIAGIDLFAPKTVDTEVVWIDVAATMIGVHNTIVPDLF